MAFLRVCFGLFVVAALVLGACVWGWIDPGCVAGEREHKDGGKSWKALDGLPFRNAQRIAFDLRDDSVIYISTFGASVWRGPAD
jgi:hypothetical protein